ncbi:MAG: hypothetical protein JRN20_00970 [Nitrososphaerota archaeon]|nr:hypothetical protein [Nitrososphaerota archaeon]MDG6923118.1 hypothetical protein [Nitrososphaerota archaeon]
MATVDAEKSKKLQQYAVALTEQAKEEERTGKSEEAVKHYLKLVDVFLVLASEAQDHNTWVQYIRQAEAYQSRTKALIPNGQKDRASKEASSIASSGGAAVDSVQHQSPLKKILKPFQRSAVETHDAEEASVFTARSTADSPDPKALTTVTESVSPEIYQRVISENKILRNRISTLAKEKDDLIVVLERKCKELEARISEMVPHEDYDSLQSEFYNSIPKVEYDRVKSELLNSVPKGHYDDLLNRVAEMVPRQVYLDAERRCLALEEMVKNSIPKKVIEDLASEISMLGVLSEVPLEKPEETKENSEVRLK